MRRLRILAGHCTSGRSGLRFMRPRRAACAISAMWRPAGPSGVRLTEPLDDCETELWLLTHPESRHLRRVGTVHSHLAETMTMP